MTSSGRTRAVREPAAQAQGVRHVLEFAIRRGAPEAPLLAQTGVRWDEVASTEARLPVSVYYQAIESGAALTSDPLFGLHYVQGVTHDTLGALGFLAMASPTLGEALARIIRFHRVLTEGERFQMSVEGERVEFSLETWGAARPAHGHIAEMYAYDCSVMAEALTGKPARPLALAFRHRPRVPPTDYQAIFHFTPTFEAGANRWTLPREILSRPMPRADAMLAGFLEPQVEAALARLPAERSFAAELLRVIVARLPDGPPSLQDVAGSLRLAPRTLQRRLAAEGQRFDSFLDGTRRAQAERWLQAGTSIAETSFLVGYSEPRAFHRAFKRWTGTTPEAWRLQTASAGRRQSG